MSIMIVENDDSLRKTFQDVLRQLGYRVRSAPNGKIALRQIRAVQPELVFVDLAMPVMNGFELISALRSDARLSCVPVVAMTAYRIATPTDVLVMYKPFRAETAVEMIETFGLGFNI